MQQSLFGHLGTSVEEQPPVSGVVSGDGKQAVHLQTGKTLLQEAVFSVIDLETTGLNAKKNSITEITAIQYQNGEVLNLYSTLVKPLEDIPEEVELLTGINNEMVRQAPPLQLVMGELSRFLGENPLLVGHNVSFDIGFLTEKIQQAGLGMFANRYSKQRSFCTKILAQKALPGLPSYEGIMVATSIGYHNPNPHRAEADVRMSAAILFAIIDRLQQNSEVTLKTVQDLVTYQGLYT
jgi:DNA polymerase III epsilon subunit family exonuclease